jgi:c-di-GMP-binding flagellar brake protein YcgR
MISAPSTQRARRLEDEKRQYPRFRVKLEIELNVDDERAPLRTRTSDVGLGGCYVEMLFTLAIGRRLDLTLWLGKEKWRSRAEVVTRDPQFGNGFRFLNLDDEKRYHLGRFLDTLSPEEQSDAI